MGLFDSPPDPNSGLYTPRGAADRTRKGKILFREDFTNPVLGMWNDGVGVAYRDTNITFGGKPTMRIDPQGATATGTTPGTMDPGHGPIVKRRIIDSFSGIFAVSMWVRWTSSSSAANSFLVISHYNRSSSSSHYGRLWLDTTNNNTSGTYDVNNPKTLSIKTLGGDNTWSEVGTVVDQGTDEHSYKPSGNLIDKTGLWWFVKLAVDFRTKNYVYCQVANKFIDLSGQPVWSSSAVSQSVMHFSVEYSTTSTNPARRYVNVAEVTGTEET